MAVLVTRPHPDNEATEGALRALGFEPLLAPVASGQAVGTVYVTLEGKAIGEYPLVALADVPPAGLFGRLWDTLRLWFK